MSVAVIKIKEEWVEVYTTSNITRGNNITIQNISNTTVWLNFSDTDTAPDKAGRGFEISRRGEHNSTWNVNDETYVWVRARSLTAELAVQDAS